MASVRVVWSKAVKPRYSLVDLAVFAVVVFVILSAWLSVKRRQLLDVVFQSPLPDVRIAEEQMVPDSRAYQKQYDFTVNWFTSNIPVWEKALAGFKGKPDVRYLEIGVYEGRSAVWMLENILTDPTARLTGVDIFAGPYKDQYFANIQRSGSSNKVRTIAGSSQLVLRELPLDSFDMIYIDGSHAKSDVLEDAVLSWRLLKEDGVLIFDDYRWVGCLAEGELDRPTDFPKAAIDPFIQCFEEHLEVIHNSNQIIVRKRHRAGQ